MADQFMRMGGRDPQGNARPVNVDENGNVLTQLTGSNVKEILIFNNVTVEPGQTITQSSQNRTDISQFSKLTVLGTTDSSHSFEVSVDPKENSGAYYGSIEVFSGSSNKFLTESFELGVTILQFRVKNNDTVPHNYRIMLLARRF
ncbi:hypothetical protein [Halobacillus sp. KGW1]|uniref:hypothetical protein n=1 Tax=Halobacillus sp. KGW1 TaxID=1793726 RepID=UPI00078608F4|nr:hypothetical protein [Halobacillus sp. KGW1]